MATLGDNLTTYPNLECLVSGSSEELLNQLNQIKLPYNIISIYGLNGKHYAWLSLTQKIRKIKKQGEK